jgi:putative transposase
VKYAFIDRHRTVFSLARMCDVLGAAKSGFYDWKKRAGGGRKAADSAMLARVQAIHAASRGAYGSPRILRALKNDGIACGKGRLERLMRKANIYGQGRRRFRVTTNSNHRLPVSPNVVARNFKPSGPNRLWLADITYLWTLEGWLYLAAVMDAYSRKIVGWAMHSRIDRELTLSALDMAHGREKPEAGLVHHSDQGSQYAAEDYQERLKSYAMTPSMSRRGNCWDNAPMESFFHSLKVEHVHHQRFATRRQACGSVFDWIEVFYNRQRMHSAIGYKTPDSLQKSA